MIGPLPNPSVRRLLSSLHGNRGPFLGTIKLYVTVGDRSMRSEEMKGQNFRRKNCEVEGKSKSKNPLYCLKTADLSYAAF
jgi:hypothetical protein